VSGPIYQEHSASVRRGRSRVKQTVLCLLAIELILTVYDSPRPVRAALTLLLCWSLWRGYKWSRWAVSGLALLGVLIAAGLFVFTFLRSLKHGPLSYVLLCAGCVAILRLLSSGDVPAFMAAQRDRGARSARAAA
jgi:hypothetical protein